MGPEVQSYPFLTVDEWGGACKSFVTACQNSIGEHDEWTATSQRNQHGVHFLRITRSVHRTNEGSTDGEEQVADAISDCGSAFEESDEEAAVVTSARAKPMLTVFVTYEILLSLSYRVPVLYFTVKDMAGVPVTDLGSIYTAIVPPSFKDQVSDVGVIGGISMTVYAVHPHILSATIDMYKDHPLTGLPSFFVHPCNTADALRQVGAKRMVLVSEYLFLWMGIISPGVGLSLPATTFQQSQFTTGYSADLSEVIEINMVHQTGFALDASDHRPSPSY